MGNELSGFLHTEAKVREANDDGIYELLVEAAAEIERLRAALDTILTLDGAHDLPDAWKIAGDALMARPSKPTKAER